MREQIKLFCISLLVFMVFAFPASAQLVTVSIDNVCVMQGDTITVPIMVNNVKNLGSGTINISYNSSIVHVTNVASGTGNTLVVQDWNADNVNGLVRIVAWDINPHSGDVIFANVTYKAVGSKLSSTSLNTTVRDLTDYYNYTQVRYTITNGTLSILSPGVTPTPTPPPSTGGGSSGNGGYVPTTPTPSPTEKPPEVEKASQTISSIEAGKLASVSFEGLDIYKISIEVDRNVSDVVVTVEKVEKPEEIVKAPEIVYSYYCITATNLTDVNVTATIEFKVSKSWMAEEEVEEATIKLYRYDEGEGWKAFPAAKIDEDNSSVYFVAEIHGFSLFAISGTKKIEAAVIPSPTPTQAPTPTLPAQIPVIIWFIILIAIFTSAIIVLTGYLLMRKRS